MRPKRPKSFKQHILEMEDSLWSVQDDDFLIMNADMPLDEQARLLGRDIDAISRRRARLGLIQRARNILRIES